MLNYERLQVFDTEGGNKPEAAEQFIEAAATCIVNSTGCDVTIVIGNVALKAYDNPQLITSLIKAITDYKLDIE